jgi:hypothetical protein
LNIIPLARIFLIGGIVGEPAPLQLICLNNDVQGEAELAALRQVNMAVAAAS